MVILYILLIILCYTLLTRILSYYLLKNNIMNGVRWDLNICCGKVDGGGINADIYQHKDLPRFKLIDDIYRLPFGDKQFRRVLCSHTIEHVDDPEAFYRELCRVGEEVTIVIPPLYDIFAVLNILEHKWIFLSFRKKHHKLPPFVPLPLSAPVQRKFGQRNKA
jgi:SAM-dependent methyltransferase